MTFILYSFEKEFKAHSFRKWCIHSFQFVGLCVFFSILLFCCYFFCRENCHLFFLHISCWMFEVTWLKFREACETSMWTSCHHYIGVLTDQFILRTCWEVSINILPLLYYYIKAIFGFVSVYNRCYPELGKSGFFPANPGIQTNYYCYSFTCSTVHNRMTNVFDIFTTT